MTDSYDAILRKTHAAIARTCSEESLHAFSIHGRYSFLYSFFMALSAFTFHFHSRSSEMYQNFSPKSLIARKIAYMEKLKDIKENSRDENEFIEAARTAFPAEYKGVRMLSLTAKNLFQ